MRCPPTWLLTHSRVWYRSTAGIARSCRYVIDSGRLTNPVTASRHVAGSMSGSISDSSTT